MGVCSTASSLTLDFGCVTNSFVDDNVRREAELQLNRAAEADFVSLHAKGVGSLVVLIADFALKLVRLPHNPCHRTCE